jgi:zinc/manganese transport system substrate-binding protein
MSDEREGQMRARDGQLPRVPAILAILTVAATALAGCGNSQPPAIPGVVRVVAGENFWGNIAAQIGGRHVRVTSILTSPAADPHLYESDVANAMAVAEAGLVIENGVGYDDFLSQLLGATRHPGRVVISAQEVLGATRPDVNPHLWYDIPRVPPPSRTAPTRARMTPWPWTACSPATR